MRTPEQRLFEVLGNISDSLIEQSAPYNASKPRFTLRTEVKELHEITVTPPEPVKRRWVKPAVLTAAAAAVISVGLAGTRGLAPEPSEPLYSYSADLPPYPDDPENDDSGIDSVILMTASHNSGSAGLAYRVDFLGDNCYTHPYNYRSLICDPYIVVWDEVSGTEIGREKLYVGERSPEGVEINTNSQYPHIGCSMWFTSVMINGTYETFPIITANYDADVFCSYTTFYTVKNNKLVKFGGVNDVALSSHRNDTENTIVDNGRGIVLGLDVENAVITVLRDDTGKLMDDNGSGNDETRGEEEMQENGKTDAGEWGIRLSAQNITAKGMILTVRHSSGDDFPDTHTGELIYDDSYTIERMGDNGQWISNGKHEKGWEKYTVSEESTRTHEIVFPPYSKGIYRFSKEFTNYRSRNDSETRTAYFTFRIDENGIAAAEAEGENAKPSFRIRDEVRMDFLPSGGGGMPAYGDAICVSGKVHDKISAGITREEVMTVFAGKDSALTEGLDELIAPYVGDTSDELIKVGEINSNLSWVRADTFMSDAAANMGEYGMHRLGDEYILWISDAGVPFVFRYNEKYTKMRKAAECLWENYDDLIVFTVTDYIENDVYLKVIDSAEMLADIKNVLEENGCDLSVCRLMTPEEQRALWVPASVLEYGAEGVKDVTDSYNDEFIMCGGMVYRLADAYDSSFCETYELAEKLDALGETEAALKVRRRVEAGVPAGGDNRVYHCRELLDITDLNNDTVICERLTDTLLLEQNGKGQYRVRRYDKALTDAFSTAATLRRYGTVRYSEAGNSWELLRTDVIADVTGDEAVYSVRICAEEKYHEDIRRFIGMMGADLPAEINIVTPEELQLYT